MADRPRRITYQAQITLPATLARLQAAREGIERAGGTLEVLPTATPGLTLARLTLPASLSPEVVAPGVPFFPL